METQEDSNSGKSDQLGKTKEAIEGTKNTAEEETRLHFQSELEQLKTQLLHFQSQLQILKKPEQDETETQRELANNESTVSTNCEEEFPALVSKDTWASSLSRQQTLLSSWKEKVTNQSPKTGINLKFIPPLIENGHQIVHIENVVDMVSCWENSIVVYVVGGNVNTDILKGFIRKHWAFVSMPVVHAHEEGYFIVKFNTENERNETLNGGPYFLNRAPMIVKQWTMNFNFRDEILRVIPVWIRLPSLPLHCWGEESLSRIVSAVGVPVLADECTAKQLKVSYARVLVEVDVTKEFVKDIRVRDNCGHEFVQKAIPEWRLFYCHKCNKLGHECKETNEDNMTKKNDVGNEGEKMRKDKKLWIPAKLVKFVQGVSSLEELRTKVGMEAQGDENDYPILPVAAAHENTEHIAEETGQEDEMESKINAEDEGDPWTPVTRGKSARRATRSPINGRHSEEQLGILTGVGSESEGTYTVADTDYERDGNPIIPSVQ
ncbi:unnamed protein product [Amaranthus hypochondriacus]